ncbi:MAG: hypothetical protein IE922_01665 [Sphingomonadales bacterium]|nr:hypothetical protein [Sphingomonadales bacterium]
MNIKELTFKGSDQTVLYSCGTCGHLFSPRIYACSDADAHAAARRAADECCTPKYCACGKPIEAPWTACGSCRERLRLEKATVITDYNGPVESDKTRGEWGEGYSSDVAALIESCAEYDDPVPAYCWPCTSVPLRLDLDRILERACEEQHEDALDQIEGADELQEAIDRFNAAQTCVTYYPDHSRVIVIDQDRFDNILRGHGESHG